MGTEKVLLWCLPVFLNTLSMLPICCRWLAKAKLITRDMCIGQVSIGIVTLWHVTSIRHIWKSGHRIHFLSLA